MADRVLNTDEILRSISIFQEDIYNNIRELEIEDQVK